MLGLSALLALSLLPACIAPSCFRCLSSPVHPVVLFDLSSRVQSATDILEHSVRLAFASLFAAPPQPAAEPPDAMRRDIHDRHQLGYRSMCNATYIRHAYDSRQLYPALSRRGAARMHVLPLLAVSGRLQINVQRSPSYDAHDTDVDRLLAFSLCSAARMSPPLLPVSGRLQINVQHSLSYDTHPTGVNHTCSFHAAVLYACLLPCFLSPVGYRSTDNLRHSHTHISCPIAALHQDRTHHSAAHTLYLPPLRACYSRLQNNGRRRTRRSRTR